MQVCHGKAAPLKRIKPGDHVVYDSPANMFGGKDGLRSFTAIGVVNDDVPYRTDMGGGFFPFRRDVEWHDAQETPIRPLLCKLQFTTAKSNRGFQLRFGLFEISGHDMAMIAEAMVTKTMRASKFANNTAPDVHGFGRQWTDQTSV